MEQAFVALELYFQMVYLVFAPRDGNTLFSPLEIVTRKSTFLDMN